MYDFKLVIFILLYCQLSIAQEIDSIKRSIPDASIEYTSEELDSIFNLATEEYFFHGDYATIVDKIPAFIENAKVTGNSKHESSFRSLFGNTLVQIDEIDRAGAIFREALEIAKERKDTFAIMSHYVNLGNTYFYKDSDMAIEFFTEAFNYNVNGKKNNQVSAILNNNLAELYVIRNQPGKAQIYLDELNTILEQPIPKGRNNELKINAYYIQGSIYLAQKLYFRSIESSEKALELANTGVAFDQNYRINTYKNLIESYDKTRQFEKLNEIRKLYDPLRDKKYEQDKLRQQAIALQKYNIVELEKEANDFKYEQQLAQERIEKDALVFWIFISIGVVLILLIITLLLARNKRYKLLKDLKVKNKQYLEAKKVSENLAKKNTKFLSTISHELRTPLYGIIGLSSVFLENKDLSNYKEEFNSLKFSADYLLSLVNDILNINKYESEKGQELKEEHFNLNMLTKSIVQTFQFLNEKNNNQVSLFIDQKIPDVLYGDKTKLSQVIMNLLSNASKFTLDGFINISIHQIAESRESVDLSFSIEDTGRGIKDENQKEIFDEFTQVSTAITEGGTGLGLPIVNKLLKILSSELTMESTYGVGTKFSFVLSLIIGSKQELESTIDTRDIKRLDHKKLLIVDDNKINQLVTQKVLEQYKMTHNTANDGQEAIDAVIKNDYDYILMDINMPVMNGIEATIEIRKLGIKTPIIALTAADDLNLERDVYSVGINSVLVKPYQTEQLLSLLIHHLH